MKRNSIVMVSLLFAVALILSACGGEDKKDPKESGATEGKLKIEVIAKGFQHQFWKAVELGAIKARDEFGVDMHFEGPEGEQAIQVQVSMLNNAIGKKPNAICLAAVDVDAVLDGLLQAKSAKIPVIGFDSGVPNAPEGSVLANASTDNEAAAALGAEKLYEIVEAKIKAATAAKPVRIGVASQEVNSGSILGRTKGFIDKMVELTSKLDNVNGKVAIVGHDKFRSGDEKGAVVLIDLRVPAAIEDASMKATIEALLNEKDLIGVFGSNEFAAKGMIRANESKGGVFGAKKVIAVGFDASEEQKNAVRSGILSGAITQDPVQIGYKAVELAIKVARGESVVDVDTGAKWYDKDNMDDADIAPLLYD